MRRKRLPFIALMQDLCAIGRLKGKWGKTLFFLGILGHLPKMHRDTITSKNASQYPIRRRRNRKTKLLRKKKEYKKANQNRKIFKFHEKKK